MSNLDLPTEIWLEILTYLSRDERVKTIGISRALFEVMFNEIYKEITLRPEDKSTIKILSQLQYSNISQRVQILVINSGFLQDPANANRSSRTAPEIYRSIMKPLKNLTHRAREVEPGMDNLDITNDRDALISAAKRGIASCTNLVEFAITDSFDTALTAEFLKFFSSIWTKNSFGLNLKKLAITEIFINLPTLLKTIIANARQLENLREVNITFAETYVGFPSKVQRQLRRSIEQIVELLKPKGTIFSFCVAAEVYHDRIRTTAPPLPYLNNLSLSFDIYDVVDTSNFAVACEFINDQASSVKKLHIHGTSQMINTTAFFGEGSCARFVLEAGPDRFHTLHLRCLEELHIDLPFLQSDIGRQPIFPRDSPLLKSIAAVAPTLKVLRLRARNHFHMDGFYAALADGLPKSLESLELSCPDLTATLFDSLSSKIPSLRKLTIHVDIHDESSSYFPMNEPTFSDTMQSRRFSLWSLQSLRITQFCLKSGVHGAHPDDSSMKVVAACFPENAVCINRSYDCGCT